MSVAPEDKMTNSADMEQRTDEQKKMEGTNGGMTPPRVFDDDGNHIPDEVVDEKPKKKCCTASNIIGWVIRGLLALVLISFLIYAIVDRKRVLDVLESFIKFIEDNPYVGPLLIIGAYIVATVLFLPGLVLTLGSGFALN